MASPAHATQYNTCAVLRRALGASGTLNMDTGATKFERFEWHTAPCNAPLFADTERNTGVCPSCAAGYAHIHNFRIEEPVQGPCPATCPCRRAT